VHKAVSGEGGGAASPEALCQLGDLYHEFCHLGLVGPPIKTFYLGRAVECYERSLAIDPVQPRVQLKRARALLRLNQPDRAESALVEATLGGLPVVEIMPWQAEVYFQRGEIELLSGLVQAMRREKVVAPAIRKAIEFWEKTAPTPRAAQPLGAAATAAAGGGRI
jgi:hypothetical protein